MFETCGLRESRLDCMGLWGYLVPLYFLSRVGGDWQMGHKEVWMACGFSWELK